MTVLALHPGIEMAMLFGSMVTRQAVYDSDIDLAVAATQPLELEEKMVLIEELAEVTGRPIDLIDLTIVGEPLLGQILKRGKRILGTDEAYAKLIMRHLADEADFMPYYRRILTERRQAWIGK